MSLNRRAFLKRATATATAVGAVRLAPAIAPTDSPAQTDLGPLLIETDRDQLLEPLAARIRGGLDYPTLLGAIAEASVRQVRPYPHVGFKYHAFMVLQAVHRTTLFGRAENRWLPVLWAADVFKGSQAAEQRLGSWALAPVPEQLVPPAHKAERAFRDAIARWDAEAADAAVVGLARSLPMNRLFALLFRYGARDFRAIGHKAITLPGFSSGPFRRRSPNACPRGHGRCHRPDQEAPKRHRRHRRGGARSAELRSRARCQNGHLRRR
jgi:hypothetical protein